MPTITGQIIDKARKEGTNGEYVEIKVSTPGREYATTIRDFLEDLPSSSFKRGDSVTVEFTERKGSYKGKEVVYRNLVSIGYAEEAEPFPGDAPPPGEPKERHQEAPQRRPAAQPSQDTREASIEAQVSVMQAREFLDRIIPMDLSMEEKIDLFKKHLPEVAHIVHATIREVKA